MNGPKSMILKIDELNTSIYLSIKLYEISSNECVQIF